MADDPVDDGGWVIMNPSSLPKPTTPAATSGPPTGWDEYTAGMAFKNMGKGALEGVKGALTGPNPLTDPIGFVTSTGVGAALALDTLRNGTREEVDKLIGSLGSQALIGKAMGIPDVPGSLPLGRMGGAAGAALREGAMPVRYGIHRLPLPASIAGAAAGRFAGGMLGEPGQIGGAILGAVAPMVSGAIKGWREFGPEDPVPTAPEYPNRGMVGKRLMQNAPPQANPGAPYTGKSSPGISYNPAGGGSPEDIDTSNIPVAPDYPNRGKVGQMLRKNAPAQSNPGAPYSGTSKLPARSRFPGGRGGSVAPDSDDIAPEGVDQNDWSQLHPDVKAAVKMGAKITGKPNSPSASVPTSQQPAAAIPNPSVPGMPARPDLSNAAPLPSYMQEGGEQASQMTDVEAANRRDLIRRALQQASKQKNYKPSDLTMDQADEQFPQ